MASFVVHNTFIEPVTLDDEEPPLRTVSDPTAQSAPHPIKLGPLVFLTEPSLFTGIGDEVQFHVPNQKSSRISEVEYTSRDTKESEEPEEAESCIVEHAEPVSLAEDGSTNGPPAVEAYGPKPGQMEIHQSRGRWTRGKGGQFRSRPSRGHRSGGAVAPISSDISSVQLGVMNQPVSATPWFGMQHRFHHDTRFTGFMSPDERQFIKDARFDGRLSVVSEANIYTEGSHWYAMQFCAGELSSADGVGFVFTTRLPCTKNIQRIISIFVNQRGRICFRVHSDVVKCSISVKPLELGDVIGMTVHLKERVAAFTVWPRSGATPQVAEFAYGPVLDQYLTDGPHKQPNIVRECSSGHLACVVKHPGVSVRLLS